MRISLSTIGLTAVRRIVAALPPITGSVRIDSTGTKIDTTALTIDRTA